MVERNQKLVFNRCVNTKGEVRFWVYLDLPNKNLSKPVLDFIEESAKVSVGCKRKFYNDFPGYSYSSTRFFEACKFAMAMAGFFKLRMQYVDSQ